MTKIKVLAIASSFRRNGNSETLLDAALSDAKKKTADIKKIALADLNIKPCQGCLACCKTGECVIQDDMQQLYRDLLELDVLLVASPIYFKGLPCQLKCVIDRCQALWARKYVLKKSKVKSQKSKVKAKKEKRRGAAILVSASCGVKDMFTASEIVLGAWFKTLDIEYKEEFLAQGLEEEGLALKDEKLLDKAVKFGEGLVRSSKG